MSDFQTTGIGLSNFKAFGAEGAQLDRVCPINVVIGRNNAGKSALLDVVAYLAKPYDLTSNGHKGHAPRVTLTVPLEDEVIRKVFPSGTSGGPIRGNHYEFGKRYIGQSLTFEVTVGKETPLVRLEDPPPGGLGEALAKRMSNPFQGRGFYRLLADRDITPEEMTTPSLESNGRGATNLIQHYLNDSRADRSLVEDHLLDGLNRIFSPDTEFTRILTQRLADRGNVWEIYLEEKDKGLIALSNSGSGLKTVILVLCNLILMPRLNSHSLAACIFGFEELENNLHPGLQRRLLQYMEQVAAENGATFFLTTHSNVAIDRFSTSADAQIIHVTHAAGESHTVAINDALSHGGLLDDLDVRASDLLQANAVVWVEGPSDRVYVNALLQAAYGDLLREGAHYQCVFYGGRLLARLSASEEEVDEFVNMLRVNRHCIMLMDRDTYRINSTKARIRDEVQAAGGLAVVTARKEIECDLPTAVLADHLGLSVLESPDTLQPFDEYLDGVGGDGRKYLRDKVGFAQEICAHLTPEHLESDRSLAGTVESIAVRLADWNQITLS
jgi:putative ATP-dependent endonuclease of OLD family